MDKGLGDGRLTEAFRRLGGSRMISQFVGREAELERLSAALSFAADSNGRAVFLVGEHGVGKTRLAQEALALARQRGFTVLEGRAFSLRTGLAYAPILEAFDPQLRNLDPVLLKRLLGDLPDLGRLFGGIECLPPIHSDGSDDPALAKTRLFSALSRLVERLSQEQPVALYIDDIHWADDATLELLHYLAQSQSQARVLLLSCYTPDGLNGSSILRDLLVSLKQDRLVDEVYIPRLRMDAVRDMVQGLLAGKASNELIETLYARTGGYPLYIESLVAGLIDAGYFLRPHAEKDIWAIEAARTGPVPPLLRDLILGHLEHLSASDRIVLDIIAISGHIATYSYLRTESGQSDKALFRSLRSLEAHCLVAERIDGAEVGYSIVHPLIREVAID
ncbi:MAG: DUF2791 family P-loop domain-containing protein, partial [Dehalococcoidia bacterium]|nr:DUF2791 family P-loop domain-containing protein [Dehalococcoidia bacterium]